MEQQVSLRFGEASAPLLAASAGSGAGGSGAAGGDDRGLVVILLFALAGGLLLNLMPCVLPVLSIKLLSAVSYGGQDRGRVRLSFLASAAGILFSFLVLAAGLIAVSAFGGVVGWGIQFQQPLFLAVMGQVRLVGDEAAQSLETLVPGDLLGLATGDQRYTQLTNETGGILDDLIVGRDKDSLFLVINASRKAADITHMRACLDTAVQLEALENRALMALQGPQAAAVLGSLVPDCSALRFMQAGWFAIDGVDCRISRSGYSGEDGFEISTPADFAEPLARRLLAFEPVMDKKPTESASRGKPPEKPQGKQKDAWRRGGGLKAFALSLNAVRKQALGRLSPAEAGLHLEWSAIVGASLAAKTQPLRLRFPNRNERRDAVLTVACEPAFALELQHMTGVVGIVPFAALIGITALEILVSVLQAYIFTILTCVYLHDALHLH